MSTADVDPAARPPGLRAEDRPAATGRRRSPVRRALVNGTAVMLGGTVLATVAAYAFQLLGGRALGAEDFAPVTVLWSVQFLIMTVVMLPVEQLIIRRLELTGGRSAGLGDSVGPLAALLGGTTLCAVTAMALLGQRLTATSAGYVVMAGLLVATYTVFAAARGHLAGRHRYRDYGIATAAEAVGRLLLAAAVLLVTHDGLGLAVVMVLAPLCVLVARPFSRAPPAGGGGGGGGGGGRRPAGRRAGGARGPVPRHPRPGQRRGADPARGRTARGGGGRRRRDPGQRRLRHLHPLPRAAVDHPERPGAGPAALHGAGPPGRPGHPPALGPPAGGARRRPRAAGWPARVVARPRCRRPPVRPAVHAVARADRPGRGGHGAGGHDGALVAGPHRPRLHLGRGAGLDARAGGGRRGLSGSGRAARRTCASGSRSSPASRPRSPW